MMNCLRVPSWYTCKNDLITVSFSQDYVLLYNMNIAKTLHIFGIGQWFSTFFGHYPSFQTDISHSSPRRGPAACCVLHPRREPWRGIWETFPRIFCKTRLPQVQSGTWNSTWYSIEIVNFKLSILFHPIYIYFTHWRFHYPPEFITPNYPFCLHGPLQAVHYPLGDHLAPGWETLA